MEGTNKEIPGVTPEMFVEAMKGMLMQSRPTMVDAAKLATRRMSGIGNL
ncbi:MAG TPA: hypothetical protein VLZ10_11195 [Thermodesulfobacteriota bacterium]|nr:hypothetical protein [Thermodesulfobacteriota bacterium]